MNLLARLNKITKKVNQNRFGVLFEACGPDGVWHKLDAETQEPLKTIQVTSNSLDEDSLTGSDVVTKDPTITFSNSSFVTIPKAGERWLFRVASSPFEGAPLKDYLMSEDRVYTEDYLGVTTVKLMEVEQG